MKFKKNDIPDLDKRRVQVNVVGHDDGTHDSHRLLQLDGPTARTVGQKHSLKKLSLIRFHNYILKTKHTVEKGEAAMK